MILKEDIKIIKNVFLNEDEILNCEKIANNTFNTWQKRSKDLILKDTVLGKISEKALYLDFEKENLFSFDMYDKFRVDDFKKHNDIDLILNLSEKNLEEAKRLIILNTYNSSFNKKDINKIMEKTGTKVIEIKSTRITDRLFDNGNILFDKMLKDDFLEYPFHLRKGNISTTKEYISFVVNKEKNNYKLLNDFQVFEKIKEEQLNEMSDYYVRTYVKQDDFNIYKADVYIVGICHKLNFIQNFNIKKMVQKNKSENSIYLSLPLNKGYSIDNFYKTILKNKNNIVSKNKFKA